MSADKPRGFWGLDLKRLVGRRRGQPAPSPPPCAEGERISEEGHLRLVAGQGLVSFHSTLHPQRLFALEGTLAGALVQFAQKEAGPGRRWVVQVPLRTPSGARRTARITCHAPKGVEPGAGVELTRAGRGRLPSGDELLEFLFSRGEFEFRYVVELEPGLTAERFEEVADRRPVFQSVPPVAQMSSFLRAITHQRRTAAGILAGLRGSGASEASAEGVGLGGQDLEASEVVTLQAWLAEQGEVVSIQVLQAFCAFFDLELEPRPGRPGVTEPGAPSRVSPLALLQVGRHFGLSVEAGPFEERFPGLAGEAGGFEELERAAARPEARRVVEALRRQGQQRTSVQILEQLGRDGNSRRAAELAAGLAEIPGPAEPALNDEQAALLALLSSCGRRYQAQTVVALCWFVDAEVGFLARGALDPQRLASGRLPTSMYAMIAVAGAFEVPLRGFVLQPEDAHLLGGLVEYCRHGLLAGFEQPGSSDQFWRWLPGPEQAAEALGGELPFSGMVLGSVPHLDQLGEADLVPLQRACPQLIACFQSDLDRSLVWQRLDRVPASAWCAGEEEGPRTRFSFLRGSSACHFSMQALARTVKVEPEALAGARGRVLVDLDDRRNRHYRFLEGPLEGPLGEAPSPRPGQVWSGEVVEFPPPDSLPPFLRELGQEALLHRSEALSRELQVLEWLEQALGRILGGRPGEELVPPSEEAWRALAELAGSPAVCARLQGVVDPRTRDGLWGHLLQGRLGPVLLHRGLQEAALAGGGLAELAALRLLFSLCTSEELQPEGFFRQVDEARYRSLLNGLWTDLCEAGDPGQRCQALGWLVNAEEVSDTTSRWVVDYELSRAVGESDPRVALAGVEGRVRLNLVDRFPLPRLILRAPAPGAAPPVSPAPPARRAQAPSGLDPVALQGLEAEALEWLRSLRGGAVAPAPPPVGCAGAPAPPPVGCAGAPAHPLMDGAGRPRLALVRALAAALAGLERAFELDGTRSRRRYLSVVPVEELEQVTAALVGSWRALARHQGVGLGALIRQTPHLELRLEHQVFVEDAGRALWAELGAPPYLGGPGRPLWIHHLRPEEPLTLGRIREPGPGAGARFEPGRFVEVWSRLAAGGPWERLRILRLSSAGGFPLEELEAHRASFSTEREVWPGSIEVFDPSTQRFVPWLTEARLERAWGEQGEAWEAPGEGASPGARREGLRQLLALLGGRPAPPREGLEEELEASEPSGGAGAPARTGLELSALGFGEGWAEWAEVVGRLRRAFSLPEELEKAVTHALLSALRAAGIEP